MFNPRSFTRRQASSILSYIMQIKNCTMNVLIYPLNCKAGKKHMFVKSMSTNSSHFNPFFFVPNLRYLPFGLLVVLVFNYDSPKNEKETCFLPVVIFKAPIFTIANSAFNSPYLSNRKYEYANCEDLTHLNYISQSSYQFKLEHTCRKPKNKCPLPQITESIGIKSPLNIQGPLLVSVTFLLGNVCIIVCITVYSVQVISLTEKYLLFKP